MKAVRTGAFDHDEANVFMFVDFSNLKIRNTEVVIVMYIVRAKTVKRVEYCKTITIQPR